MQLLLLLLFTCIKQSFNQSISSEPKIGCIKYTGSTCTQLCNLGQFDCSRQPIICEFGYFNFDSTCVQCPKQDFNDAFVIYCGDCLENSQTWQNSRICSFDFIIESSDPATGTYIKRTNEYTELYLIIESLTQPIWTGPIYRVSQIQYQVLICSGCGNICIPKTNDTLCYPTSSTIDTTIKGITCLDGYYYNNGVCSTCIQNCLKCSDSKSCYQCATGYDEKNNCSTCLDGCLQCYDNECYECKSPKIISLNRKSCESCNEYCLRCEYLCYSPTCKYKYITRNNIDPDTNDLKKYVKRCRQCDSNYVISYNGKDCLQCQIINCVKCYFTITGTDGVIRSTIDIDFIPQSDGETASKQLCYVCENGYTLDTSLDKCINNPPTTAVTNCIQYGDKCVTCKVDQVLDIDLNTCLSLKCTNYITNCQYCYQYKDPDQIQIINSLNVKSYSQQEVLFQCTQCQDGYYPDFFTGNCLECPNRCSICWQYSPTYNFTLYNQIPKPTKSRYSYFSDQPIQVQCTECKSGFTLYGNECLGCTFNCVIPLTATTQQRSCLFKSTYALCYQCFEPFYQRSLTDDKSECQECPNQCLACYDRNISSSPNPYFNPSSSWLQKYSRICYKTQSLTLDGSIVHFSTDLNMPIMCTSTQPCYHSRTIDVTLYCSTIDFNNSINAGKSTIYNYDLNVYFALESQNEAIIQFYALETINLYTEMNQQPLQELFLNIHMQGTGVNNNCTFDKTTTILTKFHKNVFSLTNFTITITSTNTLKLYVNGDFKLSDYPNIIISNIIIFSHESDFSFLLGSLKSLQIINLQFKKLSTNTFNFKLSNITTISIKNTKFYNLNNSDIMSISYSKQITLNSILFDSVELMNQQFIILNPTTKILLIDVTMNICKFYNFAFFEDPALNSDCVGYTEIQNLIIQNTLFNSSYFFSTENSQYLKILNFQLINNIISNSIIIESNQFNVQNVIAYNNYFLTKAYLFMNCEETGDSQITYLQQSLFQGINLTNNSCENTLIYLSTPFNQKNILMNLTLTSIYIDKMSTVENGTALIKIDKVGSVDVTGLVIRNLLLVTGFQVESFTYVVVNKFECDSPDSNTQLPVEYDCFEGKKSNSYCFHFEDFDRGLYIRNGVIKKQLAIDSSMIYIKSYEYLNKNTQTYVSKDEDVFFYGQDKELVILENIKFYNNTIGVFKPQIDLALITIDSAQNQVIKIQNLEFIGNHLHQSPPSVNIQTATCLFINSPLAQTQISDSILHDNRATRSGDGLVRLMVYQLSMINLTFTKTNQIQSNYADILEPHTLFSSNSTIEQQNIFNYFSILSIGSNLFVDCDKIFISDTIIGDSNGLDGAGMYIVGSDNLEISLVNITMYNIICSLEYDTIGCGIYIDTSISSLTLSIDQLVMKKLIAHQTAGIFIQSQSSKISVQIQNSVFQQCQAFNYQVFFFQQQTINTNIPVFTFQNCTIFDNHYDNYLLNLFPNQPSLDFDGQIIKETNSLIFIDFGTINLIDCQVYDISLTVIFNFQNILLLNFNNVKIYNIVMGLSTLISISLKKESGHANIDELLIKNVTEYPFWTPSQLAAIQINVDFTDAIESNIEEQNCTLRVDNYATSNKYINSFDVTNIDTNYLGRNPAQSSTQNSYTYFTEYTDMRIIKKLYSIHLGDFGLDSFPALFNLPLLDFLGNQTNNPSHTIYFNKLIVKFVSCLNCYQGLFYFTEISPMGNLSVQFTEVQFINNIIGNYGCLNLFGYSSLINKQIYTILIKNSQFISNKAVIGPAVRIVNISTYIQDSIFSNNNATKTGGALYFDGSEQTNLYIQDLVVQGNSADIASGLYVKGFFLPEGTQFPGNNGRSINEEIPQHLSISMVEGVILPTTNDSEYNDTIITYLNLPSGQQISTYKLFNEATQELVPYDWKFRVVHLDRYYRRILTGIPSDYCEISGRMLDSNKSKHTQQFLTNYTSPQTVNFQNEDYNLDNLIITFDPYLPSNYYLQLRFFCTSIEIPQGDYPYTQNSSNPNHYLYLNIYTLQCQLGESYFSQKCTACGSGTYALTRNQPICSNIEVDSMEEVSPIRIKLYPGYWRYDSDKIESCYNLISNCNGGWIPGDASCYSGHMGALCESCDIYGIRGDQYSISSKYKCGPCKDTQTTNSITIAAICIFTLLQMVLSVKGNYQMIENFIREQVLQSMGIRINQNEANLSILIKLMTNYFQIISALGTFRISIPTDLVSSINVVSNPTQSMAYSLDCFLIDFSFVPILYFRMIWALLMPLLYLSIFFFGYGIGVCVTLLPAKMGIIYTTLIYMFIYLQPTLIAGFIALLSSRTLGGTDFVQSDVQFLYSTEEHYFWILSFAGPNLLCWGAIFPYIFMHYIRKNYDTLYTITTRRKYGYFYNEYTQHAYLWEFVKIFEKQFVLMALTYYEDVIIIKGLMVFLIVFIYGILSFEFTPYQSKRLNYIDQVSSAVCVISLCLGVLIKASQSEDIYYLQIIMFLIIGALNLLFILILIYEVFRGYLNKFEEHVDKLRDKLNQKYPNLRSKYPWLKRFLINRGELKKKAKYLWSILRYETRKGIARRRIDKTQPLFQPKLLSQESEKDDHSRIESKANSRMSVIDIHNQEEMMNLANNMSSVLAKTPEIQKVYPLGKFEGVNSLTKLKKGKML